MGWGKDIFCSFFLVIMKKDIAVLITFICSMLPIRSASKTLNPIQFGLLEAKNSYERYEILYQTHCEACRLNANVSYKGIKRIEIDIPSEAKSIPLTEKTDFCGTSIYVTNNKNDLYLFELTNETYPIDISKELIDDGDFSTIPVSHCKIR